MTARWFGSIATIAERVDVVQDLNSIALAAERLEIDLLGCWV
jgi:hypothetical protein